MIDKTYNVLFLSPHDAARGIMAEAILNKLGADRFRAYSAGIFPREAHEETLRMLEKLNYDVSALRPTPLDDFIGPEAPKMDFVFTVCEGAAGDFCPVWPGQPMTVQWIVPDPAAIEEEGAEGGLKLARIYRDLDSRIRLLVNLPIEALDRLALQVEMEAIGGPQTT
jgi:arsenate reductase (thioredoxin)